jgi:hypothetical protein
MRMEPRRSLADQGGSWPRLAVDVGIVLVKPVVVAKHEVAAVLSREERSYQVDWEREDRFHVPFDLFAR